MRKIDLSYQDITQIYQNEMKMIKNEILDNIYRDFNFLYINLSFLMEERLNINKKTIEQSFFSFLSPKKLITLEITSANEKKCFPFDTFSQNKELKSSLNIVDAVFCVENKCFIIRNIIYDYLISFINQTNLTIINISKNLKFKSFQNNKENEYAFEEVTKFYFHIERHIKSNIYVENSIKPIICYIVRRYFYPSYFFQNPQFFDFNRFYDLKVQAIKENIDKTFNSNNFDEIDRYQTEMIEILKDYKIHKKEKRQIKEFSENEFTTLRSIYGSDRANFNLVIHIQSLHVFVMKSVIVPSLHEINFCSNYNHQCFTQFYGFIIKNKRKIGFLYEYMSQGNLQSYILKNKNELNPIFLLNSIIRLFNGIDFLQSHHLVHRDLKPANILINHNGEICISDFETIRKECQTNVDIKHNITNDIGSIIYASPEQISGKGISLSTDIYSFAQIVYFIFEKKDPYDSINPLYIRELKEKEFISDMKYCSIIMQNMYQKCIKFNLKHRLTINDIYKYLIKEIKMQDILKKYILKIDFQNDDLIEILHYFYEQIFFHPTKEIELIIKQMNVFMSLKIYFSKNNMIKSNSEALLAIGNHFETIQKDYLKAKYFYELASELNNSNGFIKLGDFYYYGYGVEQNFSMAKDYYERSSKLNNAESFLKIGDLYSKGMGVKQDYNLAIKNYEISGNLGNSDALLNIGIIYANGLDVEKNYLKAKKYYELSAQYKNSNAYIALGNLYVFGLGVQQDYEKAKEYYELSAEQNNSYAYLDIGNLYSFGLGVKQDYLKAKKYYEISGKLNNSFGYLALGNIYANGLGVDQDYKKAKELYELSAKQNNSCALFGLGILYANGLGVNKDIKRSQKYYELSAQQEKDDLNLSLVDIYVNSIGKESNYVRAKKCCELAGNQNNSDALFFLGILYANGIGVEQDYAKAKEYYELAAKQNNSNALLYLGTFYSNGLGVDKDYNKAKEYFELSAKQNNSDANLRLGDLYEFGYGVEQDYNKAKIYYEISSKQNNSYALFRLGDFYEHGKGVKQNVNKAKEYYELSAKQNNSDALLKLGDFYYEGTIVTKDIGKSIKYYEMSAEQNNTNAFLALGKHYESQKEFIKAKIYYELSAKQNNSDGLLKLGDLYFYGNGVEQNYTKSKYYYEQSSRYNNSEALLKLGNIYFNGFGLKKNIKLAMNYYEISGNMNNTEALLKLAYIYSINPNIENESKIIELFKHIILIHDKNDDLSRITRHNGHYFRALNELGLIYIFKSNNYINDQSIEYIKNAAFSEYPFAQNNLGILYQFQLNHNENAQYMFERSSKNNFILAFYNLGYLYETQKNTDEAIKNYLIVSNDNNTPLMFRNKIIFDEQIEKSKRIIKCLTNLKLTEYYLVKKKDTAKGKEHFIKAYSELYNDNNDKYIFNCSNNDSKGRRKNIFSCIGSFIYNSDDFNCFDELKKDTNINNSQQKCIILNKTIDMKINKISNKIKMKSKEIILNSKNDFNVENINLNFENISFNFENISNLFDFVIMNNEYIDEFIQEIHQIIQNINNVVYKPPYPILYGRIMNYQLLQKSMNKPKTEDINKTFYEGFEN